MAQNDEYNLQSAIELLFTLAAEKKTRKLRTEWKQLSSKGQSLARETAYRRIIECETAKAFKTPFRLLREIDSMLTVQACRDRLNRSCPFVWTILRYVSKLPINEAGELVVDLMSHPQRRVWTAAIEQVGRFTSPSVVSRICVMAETRSVDSRAKHALAKMGGAGRIAKQLLEDTKSPENEVANALVQMRVCKVGLIPFLQRPFDAVAYLQWYKNPDPEMTERVRLITRYVRHQRELLRPGIAAANSDLLLRPSSYSTETEQLLRPEFGEQE